VFFDTGFDDDFNNLHLWCKCRIQRMLTGFDTGVDDYFYTGFDDYFYTGFDDYFINLYCFDFQMD